MAALALVAATAAPAEAAKRGDILTGPPAQCEELRITVPNKLVFHALGVGVQIYRWDGGSWIFVAPDAVLYADDGAHGAIGTHFGGPTWQSVSGSKVIGAVSARCFVDPTAVPWLLLDATPADGPGIFQPAFIQRLNTVGGVAPTLPDELVSSIEGAKALEWKGRSADAIAAWREIIETVGNDLQDDARAGRAGAGDGTGGDAAG